MAVFVLAVGIAFVCAFLSLYVDLILRPHPGFERSARVATIGQNDGRMAHGVPYGIFQSTTDEMVSIEAATFSSGQFVLIGTERENATAEFVSGDFFATLRPRLALGRGFQAEDHVPDTEPVAVISHRLWQERFGADRDVLGTTLEVSRNPIFSGYLGPPEEGWLASPTQETLRYRIVGVMSKTVSGLSTANTAFWAPVESAMSGFFGVPERLPDVLGVGFVRRAPGVSVAAVEREVAGRFLGAEPLLELPPGVRLDVIDGIVRNFDVQREAMRQLDMFLAVSVLVALAAAANVSLFLLARAPGRRREMGIRIAVGASIRRIGRQLGNEAGLLVIMAASLGIPLSIWLSLFLPRLAFLRDAEWREVTLLDWRVLSFVFALLLILTLLVSLAPILGIRRLGIGASSRHVAARASLAQRLAGTAQIAVAGALGGAAIGFAVYLAALHFGDPGYLPSGRFVIEAGGGFYPGQSDRSDIWLERRREVIEAIPGVTAVAFGGPVPGQAISRTVMMPLQSSAGTVDIYPGALERELIDLLGLRLLHGRAPERGEDGVVVNRTLARSLWGRDNVVGEIWPVSFRGAREGAEVIGVLEDVSFEHPSVAPKAFVFVPFKDAYLGSAEFALIAAELTTAGLQQAINGLVASGALEIPITDVRSLESMRNELIAPDLARGLVTMTAASMVVLLAAFGCYGMQRHLVAVGRLEYAIRASLGAGPKAIGRLVVGRGFLLGLPGLVAGGFLTFIVVTWLRDDFLGGTVSPAIATMAVIAGTALVLLGASLGPAREARRTQPAPLLRDD